MVESEKSGRYGYGAHHRACSAKLPTIALFADILFFFELALTSSSILCYCRHSSLSTHVKNSDIKGHSSYCRNGPNYHAPMPYMFFAMSLIKLGHFLKGRNRGSCSARGCLVFTSFTWTSITHRCVNYHIENSILAEAVMRLLDCLSMLGGTGSWLLLYQPFKDLCQGTSVRSLELLRAQGAAQRFILKWNLPS
jgi:Fe2+ transport system protein B